MSMVQDLYNRDEDDVDLEQVINGSQDHDPENIDDDDNDGEHSEAEEVAPRRIDPSDEKSGSKKKVVKNPQATLNPKRLTGPRGIRIIEDFYKDVTLQGDGHEKEDLDLIMKKLEHWAHRLYPKFQFDDCIDKIANLGKKKQVSHHVRAIRLNTLTDDDHIIHQTENDDNENIPQEPIFDEFDLLLDQQIALAKSTPASVAKSTTADFDSLLTDRNTSTAYPLSPKTYHAFNSNTPEPVKKIVEKPKSINDISAEQRQRMLQNRIMAEEKRLSRLKAQQEKANNHISQSVDTVLNENDLTSTQNDVEMS